MKLGSGRSLHPQVKFAFDDRIEMRDHIIRVQPAGCRRQEFDDAGGKIEGVDVASEKAFDIGAQDLDRHILPRIPQRRAMNLRDRGRRNGFAEFGKQGFHLGPQLGLDGLARLDHRKRGQLVLQDAQLGRQLVANNIGACRKDLPELYVGRSQRRKRAQYRWHVRVAPQAQPFEGPAHDARGNAQGGWCIDRFEDLLHRARALECCAGADQPPDIVRSTHMSDFPARVQRRNAHRQVAVLDVFESTLADHVGKDLLRRELSNAFDKVLI